MLGIVDGEIVGAREVLFGTHVDIVVMLVVEHSIDACNRWYADGTRRQTSHAVGVVGRLDLQMFVEHTSDGEVANSEDDCRVAL